MIGTRHVLLTTLLLISLSICGYLILNALSSIIYLAGNRQFRYDIAKQNISSLIEILPQGFSLYVILGSIFYSVGYVLGWKLQQIAFFNQIFIIIGLTAGIPTMFAAFEKRGESADNKTAWKQPVIYYAPIILLVAISSFVLGRYPFFLSDDFGHLTIINRMIEARSLTNPLLYMPDDVNYIAFFPWHGLLASIGGMLNFNALEVFAGAKVFLSATALMSFLSFCFTIFNDEEKIHRYVICCALVYSFFAPNISIFHGVGDYRGVTQILLFQAARLLWGIAFFQDNDRRHYIAFTFLLLSVSLIHIIDNMIFVLMFFPYAIYVNVKVKDKKTLSRLAVLGVTIGVTSLFIKTLFYSVATIPFTYLTEIIPYLKSYFSQFDTFYGVPLTIITVLITVFFIRFRGKSSVITWWPAGTLLASLLLGSANPLLAGIYARLVSTDLMIRTMAAFPGTISLGICIAYLIGQISTSPGDRQFRYSLLAMLIMIGAMGRQAWIRFGLNGAPSYDWPGNSYSLLVKQPHLYKYISSLNHKVILTDLITSAPITTISSNYTYTNRPYVEVKQDRVEKSLLMMQGVGTIELVPWFCREGIDMLILNPNAPFHPEQHIDRVFKDFYKYSNNDINSDGFRESKEKYINLVEILDGAAIYSFEKKEACSSIKPVE